jgi:predicted O-methyltransferase YrrM
MEHFYKEIDGWFDYENVYMDVLATLPENATIVELGCWRGKSSSFLAVEVMKANKNFNLHFVDTWGGSPEHYEDQKLVDEINEDKIYNEFISNLSRVDTPYTIHRMTSLEAAEAFENNSVDFVFFDTNHSYGYVTKELKAWFPKVKKLGVMAGHDYRTGVRVAVDNFFKQSIEVYVGQIALSWCTQKINEDIAPPLIKYRI